MPSDIRTLEDVFTGEEAAEWDLLYIGNNFHSAFNPSRIFAVGEALAAEGMAEDSLPVLHASLRQMALDMDATEPQDVLGYMQKWIALQEEISESLPILPVYINAYFDFYSRKLHEYWIGNYPSWAEAIVPARLCEAEVVSQEDLDDLMEDYLLSTGDTVAEGPGAFKVTRREASELDASAGALASFPREIQEAIPAQYRTINEFITASLSSDFQNVKSSTLQFAFETKYPQGDTVYLVFGLTQGGSVSWVAQQAEVLSDGSVSVELQADQLEKLAGKSFALVVVSEK